MEKNKTLSFLLSGLLFSMFFTGCQKPFPEDYFPEQKTLIINKTDTLSVLVLGNSLVWHPPSKKVDWDRNWGMAASKKEKDFVHQLEKQLNQKFDNRVNLMFDNVNFDRNLLKLETVDANDNFSQFEKYLQQKPHLVILRVGDNVRFKTSQDKMIWKKKYRSFINFLNHGQDPVFIHTSSWYANHQASAIIKEVALETNTAYLDIHHLYNDKSNWAQSNQTFKVEAVGSHPGDKGMAAIAELLYQTINKYCK